MILNKFVNKESFLKKKIDVKKGVYYVTSFKTKYIYFVMTTNR